jgi:predicted nucleic acid-binding protein
MKALIDTNVIVDVIERREPFFADSYAIVRLVAEGGLDAVIPAGSIADTYYIIRKSGKDAGKAKDAIATLLQLVNVCDTAATDINAALTLDLPDFEDAILAATAKRERTDSIITRNERDFSQSPVPALSPTDFLAQWKAK